MYKAEKSIAIVAVRNSSIDCIFREREIDYYSEPYDQEVVERAVDLIEENRHNLILVYQQEYDDLLHKNNPFSEICVQAVINHVHDFRTLAGKACKTWIDYNHALIFAPDHGAHVDPITGHGDHGLDIPEDMHLFHWYGINSAGKGSNS